MKYQTTNNPLNKKRLFNISYKGPYTLVQTSETFSQSFVVSKTRIIRKGIKTDKEIGSSSNEEKRNRDPLYPSGATKNFL